MTQVTNTNILQPSGFKVIVDRNKFPNLEWFAQSVDHPSVGLLPVDQPYKRIASVPQIGDKIEYPEVTINLIVDEEMAAYQEVYDWMKRLVNEKYTPKTASSEDRMASEFDITLMILNSANVKQKSIIYRNAFPINIGNMTMAAEAEPNPILMPVSFQYTYFDLD